MKRVIFAGPSLYGATLSPEAKAMIKPPAKKGDLIDAGTNGARVIGLIDGYFEQVQSVWHKEILLCLARGIKIYAGASIGALRGAECSHFGVEGVGQIFDEFHAGLRVSDADVALTFAPAELGFQPLTLTLVDTLATIDGLAQKRLISVKEATRLADIARDMHFTRRTWDAILKVADLPPTRSTEMKRLTLDHFINVKLQDAKEVLARVSDYVIPAEPAPLLINGPLQISQTARALLREKGY